MASEPLTKTDLAEFTEEVLLPAVERIVESKIDERVPPIVNRIVDQKLGVHRDQMIDYIDRRLGAAVGELTVTIRGDRERYRDVFMNLIDVLKRNQLINEEEQMRVVKLIP